MSKANREKRAFKFHIQEQILSPMEGFKFGKEEILCIHACLLFVEDFLLHEKGHSPEGVFCIDQIDPLIIQDTLKKFGSIVHILLENMAASSPDMEREMNRFADLMDKYMQESGDPGLAYIKAKEIIENERG